MIYTFIAGHCSDLPVVACCRALKVSVSGFYEWQHRQCNPAPRTISNRELTETITEIWTRSRGTYGSPRIWAELRLGQDIPISRKRVERLMRQAGIEGVYRRRRRHGTTKRDPQAVPPDDLVNRQFGVEGPDRLWVADITEHSSVEGKVYLAVVIDAWSRRVIGWSIADHPRTELVVDALDIDRKTWTTRRELAQGIFEYIEAFYNPERRHTKINYLSPIEYETRHRPVGAVA